MEIKSTRQENIIIISISGRMDAISSIEFDKEINRLISEGNKIFILDFSPLDYISSTGLRSVVTASNTIKDQKGILVLACLRDVVKEVFDISGFDDIIPICDSVESAKSFVTKFLCN